MRHLIALSSLALFAAVPAAHAASMTNTITVTATVPAVCKGSFTTTALAFGTYIPGSGNATNQSTISVTCTNTTPFTVALNAGLYGTVASRAMKNTVTADQLTYQLYADSGYTTVWGNTVGTDTVTSAGTGMGAAKDLTVYGRILDSANLNAVQGSYSDTVTVTVTY